MIIADNFIVILDKTFTNFVQNAHFEFIGYIRDELKANDNNLELSNKEYILSILKLLKNDDALELSNIDDLLNNLGIFYKIIEDDQLSDYEEESFEIKEAKDKSIDADLIQQRDRLIDLFDGKDYSESDCFRISPKKTYDYYYGIKEYPVESQLINILSIVFDYKKDEQFCDCNTPMDINVKYPSEEEENIKLYYSRVLEEITKGEKSGYQIVKSGRIIHDNIKDIVGKVGGIHYILEDDDGNVKWSPPVGNTLGNEPLLLLLYGKGDDTRYLRVLLLKEDNATGEVKKNDIW